MECDSQAGGFSIELAELSNSEPLSYVDIGHQIELEQVASLTDLELGCIQTLNPGYLRWATHPEYPQQIAVPRDRRTLLEKGLAELQSNRFVTWEHYAIQSGDTLSQIAQQLGVHRNTSGHQQSPGFKNNCRPVLADTPGKHLA